MIDTICNITR